MPRAPKPEPERPCILVDSREQTPFCFSSNVDTQRATLPTSDYSLAGATELIALERKSLSDLVMSCASKERERYMDCMRRLGADYQHKAVIVEGCANDIWNGIYRSQASPKSVIATTLAIHIDYGVPVIWAGDRQQAAWTCEWMLTRLWKWLRLQEQRKASGA
jgi:ERCC4-type nuclease